MTSLFRRLRSYLFWLHLLMGVTGGVVIAIVSFTGAVLAFEDEILAWVEPLPQLSEEEATTVEPFHATTVIGRIEARYPGARVTSLRFHADPRQPYWVSFRDQASRYLHPGTFAEIAHSRGAWREFFSFNLSLHRYLAAPRHEPDNPAWWHRDFGHNVVSIATVAFLLLCASGLYLWWPRRLNWCTFRQFTRVRFDLQGLKRDWNWHNALGFWALFPLAVLCLTGLAITFEPVRNTIYPGSQETPLNIVPPTPDAPAASPDQIFEKVSTEVPDWTYLIFYLPRRHEDGTLIPRPLTIYTRNAAWPAQVYTPLRFDPYSGDLLRAPHWESLSFSQALRAINDTLHTGEVFGLIGKTIGTTACLAALLLIYTGWALSWRRFRRYRARRRA